MRQIYKILILIFLCLTTFGFAQISTEMLKNFEGEWYSKKEKRHLRIFFDSEVTYATVNEWTGKKNEANAENIDAYKVFPKDGKLIFPAENNEHRANYGEISIKNKKLIFEMNGGMKFTTQHLVRDGLLTTSVFKKISE